VTLPRLFEKANRTLLAAKRALEQGDAETTADRAYYSIYYAAWGLLAAAGVPRPKTHNGLIAELSRVYCQNRKAGCDPRRGAFSAAESATGRGLQPRGDSPRRCPPSRPRGGAVSRRGKGARGIPALEVRSGKHAKPGEWRRREAE